MKKVLMRRSRYSKRSTLYHKRMGVLNPKAPLLKESLNLFPTKVKECASRYSTRTFSKMITSIKKENLRREQMAKSSLW
jgi:hypothetical protein